MIYVSVKERYDLITIFPCNYYDNISILILFISYYIVKIWAAAKAI